MDIKISIVLKDKTYGFSDLLDGRELNNQTKKEIIGLIKEDIGYVFDQQIEVEQLFIPVVVGRSEQFNCDGCRWFNSCGLRIDYNNVRCEDFDNN